MSDSLALPLDGAFRDIYTHEGKDERGESDVAAGGAIRRPEEI